MADKVEFPKKYAKILKDLPEFKDTADAASKDELKQIIVRSEGNIYTIEKEKEADAKLNGAKELIKEMSAPYKDSIKVQKAKAKYALFLLEQKGEDLDNQE
jgi:hypothetical protein